MTDYLHGAVQAAPVFLPNVGDIGSTITAHTQLQDQTQLYQRLFGQNPTNPSHALQLSLCSGSTRRVSTQQVLLLNLKHAGWEKQV